MLGSFSFFFFWSQELNSVPHTCQAGTVRPSYSPGLVPFLWGKICIEQRSQILVCSNAPPLLALCGGQGFISPPKLPGSPSPCGGFLCHWYSVPLHCTLILPDFLPSYNWIHTLFALCLTDLSTWLHVSQFSFFIMQPPSPADILGKIILPGKVCLVHCRVFSSVPDLFDVRKWPLQVVTTKHVSGNGQMFLGARTHP